MGSIRNTLTIIGLSLALITLVGGLFGYIRYDQLRFQREAAKQNRDMAAKEYQWKIIVDGKIVSEEIGRLVKVLNETKPFRNRPEFARALNRARDECQWSLQGLSAKVDPVIRYEKDLRKPPGASLKRHNQYLQSVQETLSILDEVSKRQRMTTKERDSFARRLQSLADRIGAAVSGR